MATRRLEIFFYGLFMDPELLEAKGIEPVDARVAALPGFELRIGARAAVVPVPGGEVYGMLMQLSHSDLEKLYAEPSVRAYRPEPVLAHASNGGAIPALCYNLPEPPQPGESNPGYAAKLQALARRMGLPEDYVRSIH